MKKAVIWDLDGTLFDSYDVIVESIWFALKENGVDMHLEEIHRHAIAFSIKSLFATVSAQTGIPVESLSSAYTRISTGKYLQIKPMKNAIEVLSRLQNAGVENYVFTHRGKTTVPVLGNLDMKAYFREVVTSQSGFARKPDPEGLRYLIEKYCLNPAYTFYVGDRRLDMDCAANAGITGILYSAPGCVDVSGDAEKHIIRDLLEIIQII